MTSTPIQPKWSSSKPGRRRSKGHAVIRWIETHCVYTNGEWIGKPARLLLWQKLFILALFAVDDAGLRIYRWCLLGVAKKNGKTEIAAWLACYFTIGDGEPSPLVVCAAGSDEQADLVFGAAKLNCELSPTLSQITETYEKEILVPSVPGAKILRVSAAVGTNDGKNIHVVICDELHEWSGTKGRAVWTVLTNGTGSRRQPLVLQITTAGYDLETVCGEQYLHGRRVATGEVDDPRYLMWWYEPPTEEANHKDPETWRASNPSWGKTLPNPGEFFKDQLSKKTEAEFRRYFCNQWVESQEIWEAAQLWDDLVSDLELDPALPLLVGIDVGLKHDSSAVVSSQAREGRIVVRSRIWENPFPPKHARHATWKLNIADVEAHLRALRKGFPAAARADEDDKPLPGPAFFYDPHFFERSAQDLEAEGLNMVEYPQSDSHMVPASQGFFELVKTGVVAHDGDPTLRRHIRSVVAEEKPRGWRISKRKGRAKVDGAVAGAISVHEATRETPKPPRAPFIYVFPDDYPEGFE